MTEKIKACQIRITGIVQGVGFRPHVYRLARQFNLNGWVLNSSAGVVIEVEGLPSDIDCFARELVESPPPLAVIRSCERIDIDPQGFADFIIRESASEEEREVMISPDIAICQDCKREVRDPEDRRYRYPFTNCTNCGPRFTIIKDVPYDRCQTTMAPFPMCPECQEEYEDPLHRRFHAQPNACPDCGPHTTMLDDAGKPVSGEPAKYIKQGGIVAVKGLGAFHLAVDARNREAVNNLRRRKKRDAKPFAVMVRDVAAARKYCVLTEAEERWLTSPQAPIVILERRDDGLLPDDAIHPGIMTLGVMLPYTPLHYLLFDDEIDVLVMTSANISDEPLIIENDEALKKLKGIADFYLIHNRDIYNPCDDSVMRVTRRDTPQLFRRARGFVPLGIELPFAMRSVLGVGGEMKGTFCMTRKNEAFLSQHWGDLNHYMSYRKFLDGLPRFKKMLAVEPEVIACDLHPEYQSTRWAKEQTDKPLVGVQHHYAHMASCMAENGLSEEVLGLICDGTGWGADEAVWGCEILRGDYRQFKRLAHLKYVPLPGGDLTVKKPYRMAQVYLLQAMGEKGLELGNRFLSDLTADEGRYLENQIKHSLGVVPTSSCGRLFDAVSALLGICSVNRYEGQAAVELEAAARLDIGTNPYDYAIEKEDDMVIMDVFPAWEEMIFELEKGTEIPIIAGRFHMALVEMMAETLETLRDDTGINRVVLSGGVFHNQILLLELMQRLSAKGFEVYQHKLVPPGDGGISLGQAVIASEVSR
ncbi:MAG: carbamoyltransferase HypF [Candidatus Saccharibacteria bacterium]